MKALDEDIVALMTKRVYDIAGVTDGKVGVILNGKKLDVKNFVEYTNLYLNGKKMVKVIEKKSERWEVVCSLSDGQFQQVSFVNAICTSKGGTHVDYIAN
jgi:DNA topoisomerase-2